MRELDPVVLQGTLPTGEPFVLECRADTCQISDWPPGSGLFAEVSRWHAPLAGWIGADEVASVLQELVALARYDACLIADRGLIVERHDEEILKDQSEGSARRRSFIRLKRRLLAEDFPRVVVETEQQPIQLLGNLPTGEPFFLWCRSDTCLLNVGTDSDVLAEVIERPLWFGTIQRWHHPEADFLSADEVDAVLHELIDRYRTEEPTAG